MNMKMDMKWTLWRFDFKEKCTKKIRQRRWGSLTAALDCSPPDAFSPAKTKTQIITNFLWGICIYGKKYNYDGAWLWVRVEYVCTSLPKQLTKLNELTWFFLHESPPRPTVLLPKRGHGLQTRQYWPKNTWKRNLKNICISSCRDMEIMPLDQALGLRSQSPPGENLWSTALLFIHYSLYTRNCGPK